MCNTIMFAMSEKKKNKELAILNVLKGKEKPLSSFKITKELESLGHEVSDRTVRLYLQKTDRDGLTLHIDKHGRLITEKGLRELDSSRVIEKVGFLSAKIDQMTYKMNFDLNIKSGTVVVNITLADPKQLLKCAPMLTKVFKDGYAMGSLLTLLSPGERLGLITVPDGMVGICPVCSITLNGVLLKHGIPVNSRFGGLLELQGRKPIRFVEIITYDGTSIDPLEVFIRSGMTDYTGAIKTGNGRIGASFREFPAEGRDVVEELAYKLKQVGLGGFMKIGHSGQTLLEIPVSDGRAGAVVIGGLNPVSILEETGIRVYSRALSGLIEFSRLFHYDELESRLKAYI